MATGSVIGSFVKRQASDAAAGDIWARLEQEPIPDAAGEATLADLHQMITAAMAGESAYTYLYDQCRYVSITDGVLTVTLPFFVWPSAMGLAYTLTATAGAIGPAALYEEHRSFDLAFDHAAVADCGCSFAGNLTPEMPFFADDGSPVAVGQADITIAGSKVFLPRELTAVLRAEGVARGYRHDLVITVTKADHAAEAAAAANAAKIDYAVKLAQVEITCAWTDEAGATQTDIMTMEIPGCVEDLLTMCLDDTEPKGAPEKTQQLYILYVNDCNGAPLLGRWEENA